MPIDTTPRPRMTRDDPGLPRGDRRAPARTASTSAAAAAPARAPLLRRPARRAGDDRGRRDARPASTPRSSLAWAAGDDVDAALGADMAPRARADARRARARRQARELVRRTALHVPVVRDLPTSRRRADRRAGLPAVRRLRRACSPTSSRAPSAASRRRASRRCSRGPARRSPRRRSRSSATSPARRRASGSGHVAVEQHVGFDGFWTPRLTGASAAREPRRARPAARAARRSATSAPPRSSAPNGPVGTATTRTPSARAQAMSRGVSPITTVRSRGHGASPFQARPARARATGGRSARSGGVGAEPALARARSTCRSRPRAASAARRPRRCRSRARAASRGRRAARRARRARPGRAARERSSGTSCA